MINFHYVNFDLCISQVFCEHRNGRAKITYFHSCEEQCAPGIPDTGNEGMGAWRSLPMVCGPYPFFGKGTPKEVKNHLVPFKAYETINRYFVSTSYYAYVYSCNGAGDY